jgi:glutamate-1-semialdehyde 2,1-aminomutase
MLMEITNPRIFTEVNERKHIMEEFGAAFSAEGIISLAGSRLYTSMADTDEVIDEALERFESVLKDIVEVKP